MIYSLARVLSCGRAALVWLAVLLLQPRAFAAPVEALCARGGMVVSACPLASTIGARILRDGGNAVDAAVAVGFALAVTFPGAGNIGGGGFMLIRLSDGESVCIDYRERAPAGASRDMYLDDGGEVISDLSTIGHLSAGVPGTVAGLYLAHGRYGTLPWKDLLQPAIDLARNGFPVSRELALSFERLLPHLGTYPGLSVFVGEDGSCREPGDLLVQADLARTLERIAFGGAEEFYEGETAELLRLEMERGGGLIDRDDLSDYEAVVREPVRGSYRGYEILSMPPPSSGGIVLLEILNIAEGFPLSEYGFLSDEAVHVVVEAEKRAYR
ncbi:MAG TPA: gamma-glutamyltransferase, partial [Candidatus Eisenbacteria bacterium]|nr:gamma-glutamyltransferase [Candidatus Eisenbacteria bacterium]